MSEFTQWLTDTSNFPDRANCCVHGPWPVWFQWFYGVGPALIALAYFVNPLLLRRAYYKHKLYEHFGVPARLAILYAAFIFACGVGHLLADVMPFWWPSYHLIAVWNLITAFISWATNFAFLAALAWLAVNQNEQRDRRD